MRHARSWLPLLALASFHALLAPSLQAAWLAGLASEGPVAAGHIGLLLVAPALRVRVLLLVPAALWGATIARVMAYAQLAEIRARVARRKSKDSTQ